jgi:3-dehydroquinate synthetase
VRTAGLPATIPRHIAAADLLSATRGDKKNRAGGVRYSLPVRIGEMQAADGRWSVAVEDEALLDLLR